MKRWIWQQAEWPHFFMDESQLISQLMKASYWQGRLSGIAEPFSQSQRQEALAEILVQDVIKTSAIEGEILQAASVRSSVARRLGIEGSMTEPCMIHEGILDISYDAIQNDAQPLTRERLFAWHAALFPMGYSNLHQIRVGQLRGDETMRVVSGAIGKEKIHFEAPPRQGLAKALDEFLLWFNQPLSEPHSRRKFFEEKLFASNGFIRAGITHLWFVTLHPFEDGNGRIARAITDMALKQSDQQSLRLYSMSMQIQRQRQDYYQILEDTQRGTLNITAWLDWFLRCLATGMLESEQLIQSVVQKARFWQQHFQTELNARQRKVLNRLLDAGPSGFEGGMNTRKYVALNKVSKATACRELTDLLSKGCLLKRTGGGRNTAYDIKW